MRVIMDNGLSNGERCRRMNMNRGQHVYFENNPGDPCVPHTRTNTTHVTLEMHTWPEGWLASTGKEYTKGGRQATREEFEKIIREVIPTSRCYSQTHKIVVASFIPCPCCNHVSLIIRVECWGESLNLEADKAQGWYRLDISAMRDGQFKAEVRRLTFDESPFLEKIFLPSPEEAGKK